MPQNAVLGKLAFWCFLGLSFPEKTCPCDALFPLSCVICSRPWCNEHLEVTGAKVRARHMLPSFVHFTFITGKAKGRHNATPLRAQGWKHSPQWFLRRLDFFIPIMDNTSLVAVTLFSISLLVDEHAQNVVLLICYNESASTLLLWFFFPYGYLL